MQNTEMQTANDIKIDVLGWAITKLGPDEALASELRFSDGKRRADLAIISSNRLCAIEVKGPRDNLTKLRDQVADYSKMFLEVYVATSNTFMPEVRQMVPRTVGLIAAEQGCIDLIRHATPRARLPSASWAQWLLKTDFDELHHVFGTSRRDELDSLRLIATTRLSNMDLQTIALTKIHKRAVNRHNAFVAELGRTMTLDDVQMLTIESRIRR